MGDHRVCAATDSHPTFSCHEKEQVGKSQRIVVSCVLAACGLSKKELACNNEHRMKCGSPKRYKTEFEMTEELIQRGLVDNPERMKEWCYYNIGSTTVNQLACAGIIPKRDYSTLTKKKPDAIITNGDTVVAVIEYKSPAKLRTKKQIESAIGQELEVAKALNAKIYIVTDGLGNTAWINALTGNRILYPNGNPVELAFSKESDECIDMMRKMMSSLSCVNDVLAEKKPVDPLPLAKQVWQDLWSVSGAKPDDCLYSFVETFIFKYLSDLQILPSEYSFDWLMDKYGRGTEKSALEYYASLVRPKIKELFPPSSIDHTTIINGTIFISKDGNPIEGYATVFWKILERFRGFGSLENIDKDFKSKLFEAFLKESISKKNWGQFFTPLAIVKTIVKMADVRPGMSVCDPACGVGKFLLEAIADDPYRFFKIQDGCLSRNIELIGYDKGFDREEQKTIIMAKANMLIYLSSMIRHYPSGTKEFAQLFNDTFVLKSDSILGTLSMPVYEKYDLILTNPPYVMSGSSNLKELISGNAALKSYYKVNAMGVEGLFMEWIVRALKRGGKAFIVVPDGVMNRSNDKRLRDFIIKECDLDAVISLPLNTFFSTNKKTYILAITKKELSSWEGADVLPEQTTPVFTYLCSEIGETRDMYRFPIEQNDCEDAANCFNSFKGAKNSYISTDPRCKLFPIDAFKSGSSWSVDRWWTPEEKVALGIKEGRILVTPSDFSVLMGELSEKFHDLQILTNESDAKSDIAWKAVRLSDGEIFELSSKSISKNRTELHMINTGDERDIPVYSAQSAPVAFIKQLKGALPVMATPESKILSFASNGDGSAGRNFILHDRPFYISRDRVYIRAKRPDILVEFVSDQLADMKERFGFNHSYKANRKNVGSIEVKLPLSSTGGFDIEAQKKYSKESSFVSKAKDFISQEKEVLQNLEFDLGNEEKIYDNCAYFAVCDLLTPVKGSSKYTRAYIREHCGEYPVYSASSKEPMGFMDHFDYEGKYLSWSTNGFAGKIMMLEGRFSINGDRGLLIPKNDRQDLHLDYLRYELEPVFRMLAKGRRGDNDENEFTKLYPSMLRGAVVRMPLDANGGISLIRQVAIADRYGKLEKAKMAAISTLDSAEQLTITPL